MRRGSGLMDIKDSIPGYSMFLSQFTDSAELVCVTLMANKEGVDFTNLGRRIAGAFGDLLPANYDDNNGGDKIDAGRSKHLPESAS